MSDPIRCIAGVLLAENAFFEGISSGFKPNTANPRSAGDLALIVVVIALGAVAVWALARFATRKDVGRTFHNPRALFGALCHAHRLDRGQRQLLKKIVRRNRLSQPAAIFLLPEVLEAEIRAAEPPLDQSLKALRGKLFGDLPADEVAPASDVAPDPRQECTVPLFDDVAVPSIAATNLLSPAVAD
jgi:hypothetical protein